LNRFIASWIVAGGRSKTMMYIRAAIMIEEAMPTTLIVHAVRPPADGFTTEANIPAIGTRNGIIIKLE